MRTKNFLTPKWLKEFEELKLQAASVKQIDLKIKKALKDGAYKRWKKLLKQKASSIKHQAGWARP